MDFWYFEYEKYCEKCDLLELIPLTFDEWLSSDYDVAGTVAKSVGDYD